MKTFVPKPADVKRQWYVIDAKDVILGRLATNAADLLRGSKKPTYSKHVDMGDHVIVINAKDVALSGSKEGKKLYKHSGFPGGLSSKTYKDLQKEEPERIIENAVKGMLPKNRLAKKQILRLHVFAGEEHNHQAQQPKEYKIVQVSQQF